MKNQLINKSYFNRIIFIIIIFLFGRKMSWFDTNTWPSSDPPYVGAPTETVSPELYRAKDAQNPEYRALLKKSIWAQPTLFHMWILTKKQ